MELSSAAGFSGLSVPQIGAGRKNWKDETFFLGSEAGKKLATPAADAAVGIIQQVAVKQVKKVAPAAGQAVKKAMPVAGKAVKKAIVRH